VPTPAPRFGPRHGTAGSRFDVGCFRLLARRGVAGVLTEPGRKVLGVLGEVDDVVLAVDTERHRLVRAEAVEVVDQLNQGVLRHSLTATTYVDAGRDREGWVAAPRGRGVRRPT